jgi:hypothetical protein
VVLKAKTGGRAEQDSRPPVSSGDGAVQSRDDRPFM